MTSPLAAVITHVLSVFYTLSVCYRPASLFVSLVLIHKRWLSLCCCNISLSIRKSREKCNAGTPRPPAPPLVPLQSFVAFGFSVLLVKSIAIAVRGAPTHFLIYLLCSKMFADQEILITFIYVLYFFANR